MTGKRGPLTGAVYGQKTGPDADPDRQRRLGRPSHTAKSPAKRATKAVAARKVITATAGATPAVPAHLGVVGVAIWHHVWEALPVLSPRLDLHSVTRYCEASEDAVRARAEVEKRGLLIDEPMSDPRGGILGYRAVLNPAEAALRRADRVITELGDRLGLSPAARARLGLVINQAELAAAEAGRILGGMFAPNVIDIDSEGEQ